MCNISSVSFFGIQTHVYLPGDDAFAWSDPFYLTASPANMNQMA